MGNEITDHATVAQLLAASDAAAARYRANNPDASYTKVARCYRALMSAELVRDALAERLLATGLQLSLEAPAGSLGYLAGLAAGHAAELLVDEGMADSCRPGLAPSHELFDIADRLAEVVAACRAIAVGRDNAADAEESVTIGAPQLG